MADDNFLRQSQVVTSFGPGALVDLPEHSIIVGGLGTWRGQHLVPVHEKRLEAKLARVLGQQSIKLFAPPPFDDRDEQRRSAIGGFVFPTWFETQATVAGGGGANRRRRLVGWDGTETAATISIRRNRGGTPRSVSCPSASCAAASAATSTT